MNWTIRNRLFAGCGVLVAVLAITCLLGWRQAANSEKQVALTIRQSDTDLNCKESVKDIVAARAAATHFLLQKDATDAETVSNLVADAQTQLGKAAEHVADNGQKADLEHARELAGRYLAAFGNIVQMRTRRGLTPEAGLEGELRTAAHDIEAKVSNVGIAELNVLLLQCRRHEKDYLLRGNTNYLADIAKCIDDFGKQMTLFSLPNDAQASLTAAWKNYFEAMQAIVDLDRQIESADVVCRQASSEFEDQMKALSGKMDSATLASQKDVMGAMSSAKVFMSVILVAGLVLGGVTVFFLARSITRPIRAVTNQLIAGADQTTGAAGQVSSASQTLAEGASEQAASHRRNQCVAGRNGLHDQAQRRERP